MNEEGKILDDDVMVYWMCDLYLWWAFFIDKLFFSKRKIPIFMMSHGKEILEKYSSQPGVNNNETLSHGSSNKEN